MFYLLLALVSLAQIANGTPTNSTSSSFPQPAGGVTARSVWSILGSCALTLLICIWHAIHFDVDYSQADWYKKPLVLVLASFFAPEVVVTIACKEWWGACDKTVRFREKGYQWSMTHSFFAEMGGFVYRDEEGKLRTVESLEFLNLCEANKIANPVITAKEIKAMSKSDALGKAILTLQLLWFTQQVVVRGSYGLAVTLIELDTVSMAALTLLVLWFWWEKPFRPECPHIFYYSPPGVELYPRTDSILRNAWKPEHGYLYRLMARFIFRRKTRSITDEEEIALVGPDERPAHFESGGPTAKIDEGGVLAVSLCTTWLVLGGLHLIAWDFHFPTGSEKILWRVASLVLAGGPLVFLASGCIAVAFASCFGLDEDAASAFWASFGFGMLFLGIVSRALLVGLMLASLRALPSSAYQTVVWTAYIPHL